MINRVILVFVAISCFGQISAYAQDETNRDSIIASLKEKFDNGVSPTPRTLHLRENWSCAFFPATGYDRRMQRYAVRFIAIESDLYAVSFSNSKDTKYFSLTNFSLEHIVYPRKDEWDDTRIEQHFRVTQERNLVFLQTQEPEGIVLWRAVCTKRL